MLFLTIISIRDLVFRENESSLTEIDLLQAIRGIERAIDDD